MFEFLKKKKIEKKPDIYVPEELISEDWTDLTIRLHSNKPGSAFHRLDVSGNSILIYYNGLLQIPEVDYKFLRMNLQFTKVPRTGTFITILKISDGDWQIWRIRLDKECYESLTIQGTQKILEV